MKMQWKTTVKMLNDSEVFTTKMLLLNISLFISLVISWIGGQQYPHLVIIPFILMILINQTITNNELKKISQQLKANH